MDEAYKVSASRESCPSKCLVSILIHRNTQNFSKYLLQSDVALDTLRNSLFNYISILNIPGHVRITLGSSPKNNNHALLRTLIPKRPF